MIRRYILEGVTVSDGCELIDRLGTPAEAEELESAGRALPPHPPTRPCRWALASHPLGLDEAGRGAVARPCRNLRPCRPAGDALVPGYAGRPWAVTLPLLESVLVDRRHALLDAQAKAGSTGATVAQDLLVEHATSVGTASTPAGGGVPVTPAGGAVDPTCTALWSPEFRAAARAVLSHDVTTTEGRLDAIADGFATDVPLAVRTLCAPTKELSKRHPALALLSDLHGDLGLYFTRITTASVTGAVAPRLKKYTFEGAMGEDGRPPAAGVTFLRQLLDFDLVSMDWLGSPGGLLAYMAARDATSPMAPPPAAEVFTTPAVVAELAPFIHKLLVGMGAADTLAPGQQGYTFLTWAEKYSQHLKLVLTLPSEDEQSLFLDHCHALFLAALRSCGAQLREAVHSLRPQHRALSFPLFTDTEEPTKALLAREKVISQVADLRHEWEGFMPPSGPQAVTSLLRFPRRKGATTRDHNKRGGALDPDPEDETAKQKRARLAAEEAWRGGAEEEQPMAQHWFDSTHLYSSGHIYDVAALSKKLGVKFPDKCWEFLLSRKQGANRAKMCSHWGATGHATATDAAHTLASLDLAAVVVDAALSRQPTAAERKFLRLAPLTKGTPGPPHGRGKGKGRGGARAGRAGSAERGAGIGKGRVRGRGRGRSRFGRSLDLTGQGEQ